MKSKSKADLFERIFTMNLKDKIESFEELGWSDPELDPKVGLKKSIEWLRRLNFYNYVYPNDQMDEKKVPLCIFVPEKAVLRKMIKALAKCKTKQ